MTAGAKLLASATLIRAANVTAVTTADSLIRWATSQETGVVPPPRESVTLTSAVSASAATPAAFPMKPRRAPSCLIALQLCLAQSNCSHDRMMRVPLGRSTRFVHELSERKVLW